MGDAFVLGHLENICSPGVGSWLVRDRTATEKLGDNSLVTLGITFPEVTAGLPRVDELMSTEHSVRLLSVTMDSTDVSLNFPGENLPG